MPGVLDKIGQFAENYYYGPHAVAEEKRRQTASQANLETEGARKAYWERGNQPKPTGFDTDAISTAAKTLETFRSILQKKESEALTEGDKEQLEDIRASLSNIDGMQKRLTEMLSGGIGYQPEKPQPKVDTITRASPNSSYVPFMGKNAQAGSVPVGAIPEGMPGNMPINIPTVTPPAGATWAKTIERIPGMFGAAPNKTANPYANDYPDAFLENGVWKVMRDGKKYRIED